MAINIKERLFDANPFKEFTKIDIQNLISKIGNTNYQEKLYEILEKVKQQQEDLENIGSVIEELQHFYSQEINDFLEENKPFQRSKEDRKKIIKDTRLREEVLAEEKAYYWKLFKYTRITNDLSLLKRWGVDYPFSGKENVNPIIDQDYLKQVLDIWLRDEDFIATLGKQSLSYVNYLLSIL